MRGRDGEIQHGAEGEKNQEQKVFLKILMGKGTGGGGGVWYPPKRTIGMKFALLSGRSNIYKARKEISHDKVCYREGSSRTGEGKYDGGGGRLRCLCRTR
ncbi:hypothetical protein SDC9_148541 [bioreactor metagenome]|uniref:Uncharacterized protein n=1 Tax=bioreactor metagenome TaxID=1076179 RepID=A0A645EJ81_9ZZZZ